MEEHSGDLNKLQHFTESRIRVCNDVLWLKSNISGSNRCIHSDAACTGATHAWVVVSAQFPPRICWFCWSLPYRPRPISKAWILDVRWSSCSFLKKDQVLKRYVLIQFIRHWRQEITLIRFSCRVNQSNLLPTAVVLFNHLTTPRRIWLHVLSCSASVMALAWRDRKEKENWWKMTRNQTRWESVKEDESPDKVWTLFVSFK